MLKFKCILQYTVIVVGLHDFCIRTPRDCENAHDLELYVYTYKYLYIYF